MALSAAAGNLVTLLDIDEQVRDLERETDTTDHELAALLGLAPAVKLRLTGDANERLPERAEVDAALARLADRRPDLRALRAGYESGDRKLRQAILAQFPTLQVGVTRDRGTDKTRSVGIGITLGLPLLNGNRGNVAIQEATREQLGREYQARLDAAYGEVDQLRQRGGVAGAAAPDAAGAPARARGGHRPGARRVRRRQPGRRHLRLPGGEPADRARRGHQRGGSGNLDSGDEWSFCLTAARMAADQERR